MTNQNLLPGLLDDSIEFFIDADNIKAITNGAVIDFANLSFDAIKVLQDAIDSDHDVKMHLFDMHPTDKYKRLEQFVKCRFGGLDYQADMSSEGLQDGEWWPCALRGSCASEGVLCKAVKFNGQRLDNQDVNLVQQLSTNNTNEVIASEMDMPMGSLHLAKKKLYRKLGIQTKQEATIIGQRLNLI